MLDQDIRKLPAPVKPRDRRNPNNSNTQTISTEQTSLSTPSTTDGPTGSGFSGALVESTATSASEGPGDPPVNYFMKDHKSDTRREHPLRVQTNFDSPPQQTRYWNEFDDGDEASPDEVYTLFVDPHSHSGHTSAQMMARMRAWGRQATSWLRPVPRSSTPDRQPLIGDDLESPQSSPEGDESDLENGFAPLHPSRRSQTQRHYSTIQAPSIATTQQAPHSREHHPLFRTLVAFFTASSVFLLVAAVLVIVSFQDAEGPTLAFITGVVISVVESLVFALLGIGTLSTASHEQRRGIPMLTVGLSFVLESLCGIVLMLVVLNGG